MCIGGGKSRTIKTVDRPALFAYLPLMLSSMASLLFLWKSSGAIWTRSAIFVLRTSQTVQFSSSAFKTFDLPG